LYPQFCFFCTNQYNDLFFSGCWLPYYSHVRPLHRCQVAVRRERLRHLRHPAAQPGGGADGEEAGAGQWDLCLTIRCAPDFSGMVKCFFFDG